MQIQGTRQGSLVKNLDGHMAYRSFRPAPLDSILPLELSDETGTCISACNRKLGELVGMSRFIPNADMYLTMYVRKEALLSAQIEGTQCTFDDVLNPQNQDAVHREVSEVVSYINAMSCSVERMKEFPLCTRLLREVHKVLLANTRGDSKSPGEMRVSQNWIGPAGCTLQEAPYIPPNVEDMRDALSDLDKFINYQENLEPIVKAALVHYQFETIHPFLDGNGRLGRLLITLSLINDGVLPNAILYPSYQLKARRSEYYQRLTDVRERGAYEAWVDFFCTCLLESTEDAIESMGRLVEVHANAERRVRERMGRGVSNALRLLELIERHPILDIPFAVEELSLSRSGVTSLVKDFCELGILSIRDDGRQRYRVYTFDAYLDILRGGAEPL